MNETLGKIHFWLSFVGAYCIFMPFHYLGMAGNVRRYQAFVDDYLQPLIPLHKFITVAALLTGLAQFIFIYNLFHSRFWGAKASLNPWEALRSSGARRHRRRRLTTSAARCRWCTTIPTSTGLRVDRHRLRDADFAGAN